MKKILAFTLICASLFALASCADIDATASESTNTTSIQTTAPVQEFSEKKEYYENGNVKTLTLYDKDGNIASVSKYNKLGYCTAEYSYDSKGKVILEKTFEDFDENGVARIQNVYEPTSAMTVVTVYSEDRTYIERITSYNEDYLPVKDEYWNAENKLLKYDLYEYHDNLNIKSISYYKNGEKDAFVTYDKNGVLLSSKESGQPAKIYFYNENGEFEETKEHIYSVGEAVQVQKYSESGNLLYSLDYEINVLGATFKSRTDFTDDSGKSFIKTVYEYKKDGSISEITAFNEKGLVVKEERFGNGTNIRDSKTIYHYNDKNLLAKEEHYYDNELSNYYLFEYYENDALYKIFRYFHYEYIDSVYVDKIFLEYCLEFYENGNWKKYTYYANGILKNETEYDKNEIETKKISYYENGLFRLEILYTNGKQSKKIFYNEDGTTDYYIVYEDYRTVHYYPDGTPKTVIATGKTTYYTPDGSVDYYVIGDSSYYANGNIRSVTEHSGYYNSTTKYYTIDGEYDGCLVKEDNGFVTETRYDAEGNVISVNKYSNISPD